MTQNPSSYLKDWDLVKRRISVLNEGTQDLHLKTDRLRYSDGRFVLPKRLDSGASSVKTTPNSIQQVLSRIGIPSNYFHRVEARSPALANEMMNDGLQSFGTTLQFKFWEDQLRGVLQTSDKVVDNTTVVSSASRILEMPYKGKTDFEIISCSISPETFYLKIIFDDEFRDETGIREGSYLKVGVVIRNTEVNNGSFMVKPFVFRYSCLNDSVVSSSDKFETRNINIDPREIREGVSTVIASARVEAARIIESVQLSSSKPVRNPKRRIQELSRDNGLTPTVIKKIIRAYLKEPDPTSWGVGNAFTRAAQLYQSDDRMKLETIGGQIMEGHI